MIGDYCLHALPKKTLAVAWKTWSRRPLRCWEQILNERSNSSDLSSIHPTQEVHSRFLVSLTLLTSYVVHVVECNGTVWEMLHVWRLALTGLITTNSKGKTSKSHINDKNSNTSSKSIRIRVAATLAGRKQPACNPGKILGESFVPRNHCDWAQGVARLIFWRLCLAC